MCFSNSTISEISKVAQSNNLNIEFSSSLKHNLSNVNIFNKFKINSKLIHNYFPAPKNPFVLNLASKNDEIRELSIKHCISNIELSAKNKINFYAAHAGFCVDPELNNLGEFIQLKKGFVRSEHIDIFIESLNKILKVAESLKVNFYIENNVISNQNFRKNGNINSFLCCEAEEINYVFKKIKNDYFGLLLDTAHLKVSSSTLNLNPIEEVNKILYHIGAIHHSDNNGKIDSNDPLDKNYWFLKFKKYFDNWSHIIEVKNLTLNQINEQVSIIS
jgi:sugar phosphate isomerase/epimerase